MCFTDPNYPVIRTLYFSPGTEGVWISKDALYTGMSSV